MDDDRADDVRDVDEAKEEKDALDDFGRSTSHRDENEERRAGDERDLEGFGVEHVQISAEDRCGRGYSGELGRGVSDVAYHEEQQAPKRNLDAEVLADE